MNRLPIIILISILSIDTFGRCLDQPEKVTSEYLLQADLIFFGKVTDVTTVPYAQHEGFSDFVVESIWKGPIQDKFRIYPNDSVHGYPFEKGEDFLVFSYFRNGKYISSICTLTCQGEECLEQLRLLGDPSWMRN